MLDIRGSHYGRGQAGWIQDRGPLPSGLLLEYLEKGKQQYDSRTHKFLRRQSYHSTDHAKPLKNSSVSTKKTNKPSQHHEKCYFLQMPTAPQLKRKSSYKHSKNQNQKSANYSQIYSCIDMEESCNAGNVGRDKKGNSFSSTTCSRKQACKKNRSGARGCDLGQMLIRSTLLLSRYRTRCDELQKENGQIKRKYDHLSKKLKHLKKTKGNDLISIF